MPGEREDNHFGGKSKKKSNVRELANALQCTDDTCGVQSTEGVRSGVGVGVE